MPPEKKSAVGRAVKGKKGTSDARKNTRAKSRKRCEIRKAERIREQQSRHLENVRNGTTRWQFAKAMRAEARKGKHAEWLARNKTEQLPASGW